MCKLKVIKSYSGHFLALFSGLIYGLNGAFIKLFNLSFIEAVFIRCLVQIAISGLGFFLSGCNISIPESDGKKTLNYKGLFFPIALQVKNILLYGHSH